MLLADTAAGALTKALAMFSGSGGDDTVTTVPSDDTARAESDEKRQAQQTDRLTGLITRTGLRRKVHSSGRMGLKLCHAAKSRKPEDRISACMGSADRVWLPASYF